MPEFWPGHHQYFHACSRSNLIFHLLLKKHVHIQKGLFSQVTRGPAPKFPTVLIRRPLHHALWLLPRGTGCPVCFRVQLCTVAMPMHTLSLRFSLHFIVCPALLIIAIISADYNNNSLNKARILLMMIRRILRILNWNNNIISGFNPNRPEIKCGPRSQGNWGIVYIVVAKPLFLPHVRNQVESRFKIAIMTGFSGNETLFILWEAIFRRSNILRCF